MRVHPAPLPRRRYDGGARQKNLRRLPHIFAKVLELPFHSDADVSVEETINCFRFIAGADDISGEVRADTVEIYPGVTKIVIRGSDFTGGELEIDTWRFRLPETTRPEMATAEYREGVLMVTVPKGAEEEVEERGRDGFGAARLVLVQ